MSDFELEFSDDDGQTMGEQIEAEHQQQLQQVINQKLLEEQLQKVEGSHYDKAIQQSHERYLRLQRLDECGLLSLDLLKQQYGFEKVEIATMAGRFDFGGTVDLTRLIKITPNGILNRLAGKSVLQMSLQNPPLSLQITSNGHVSIFGARNTCDIYLGARRLAYLIRKSGVLPTAKVNGFAVNNIVVSVNTGRKYRLDVLARSMQERVPELDAHWQTGGFPCVVAKGKYPNTNSVKIFGNGAILIMGLTTIASCTLALEHWYHVLDKLNADNDVTTTSRRFGSFVSNEVFIDSALSTPVDTISSVKRTRGKSSTKSVKRESNTSDEESIHTSDDESESDYDGSDSG